MQTIHRTRPPDSSCSFQTDVSGCRVRSGWSGCGTWPPRVPGPRMSHWLIVSAAWAAISPPWASKGFAWYRHEQTVEAGGIGMEFETRAKEMGAAVPESQSLSYELDSEGFKLVADKLVEEAGVLPMLHRQFVAPDHGRRPDHRDHHRIQGRARGDPCPES